jgi:hypothetical protein
LPKTGNLGMNRQLLGQFRHRIREIPVRAREDLLHDVGSFKADRESPALPGVVGARVERPVWLEHRRRGEFEIPLAARTVIRHVAHERRALADHFPVDSILAGNDGVRLNVGQRRQCFLEQAHRAGIIAVAHHSRSDAGQEVFLYGKIVEHFQKGERLRFGQSAHEFSQRLGHDADGFHFISLPRKLILRRAQHGQSLGNLLRIGGLLKAHECRNRPDLRLGIVLRLHRGNRGNREQQCPDEPVWKGVHRGASRY